MSRKNLASVFSMRANVVNAHQGAYTYISI